MKMANKGLFVAAFVLVACSGRDVDLGGGGAASSVPTGGGSVIGHEAVDGGSAPTSCGEGCAVGEKCCIIALDVQACTTGAACLATTSCPPVPCEPKPPSGAADASAGEADAGSTIPTADGGAATAACGAEQCASGQDCCIVTTDAQTCTTGLQCVWGGCPPAPCDPHGGG